MIPHVSALLVSVDGVVTVIAVTAGAVPAGSPVIGGHSLKSTGELYVVFV